MWSMDDYYFLVKDDFVNCDEKSSCHKELFVTQKNIDAVVIWNLCNRRIHDNLMNHVRTFYRLEDAVIRYLNRKPAAGNDAPGST